MGMMSQRFRALLRRLLQGDEQMKARIRTRGKKEPSKLKVGISMPFEMDLSKFIYSSGNLRCPECGGNQWLCWHETEVSILMDACDHDEIRLNSEVACIPHLARDIKNSCLAISKRLEVFRGMVDCIDECCGCGLVFTVFSDNQEDQPWWML